MLILTRKPGESIYIGDDIKIVVVEIKGHQIRLGIDAPRDKKIYREEIWLQIKEENELASQAPFDAEGLEGLSRVMKQPLSSTSFSSLSSKRSESKPSVEVKRKKKSTDG